MARKRVGPNAPCPCGSGKKYKRCCRAKGLEYFEDEDGGVSKSVPISPEMSKLFMEQRRKFIDKFGREPGPDDPIFFDMPPTEHIEHQTVEAMKKAGIDPAIIYAFEKTGRLVTEENQHLLSDADLDEWDTAVEEYELRQPRKKPEFPIGTVAMYGPNDTITTKYAAAVITHEGAEPIMQRWVASDITTNPKIQREVEEFFKSHGVKQIVMSDGNMGCPHEEGPDFPHGEDCPFCPFWKGKQGSNSME